MGLVRYRNGCKIMVDGYSSFTWNNGMIKTAAMRENFIDEFCDT